MRNVIIATGNSQNKNLVAYLIKFSYFEDALRMLFIGDGNCAEVVWSLLGISIPGWVLIACVQILLMSALVFKVKN